MKCIVCIKQVPDVSELKFDLKTRTLIREGVRSEINPFDRRALTFAAELKKQHGGEVVVVTMGPPQAKEALVEALACGTDRALHLLDRAFAGSDTLATARALSLAIGRERPFDLILCGKYSVDAETGQIGPELAQLLGIPHASGATAIEFKDSMNGAIVDVETDYGFQRIEARLPMLITAAERLIKPSKPIPEEIEVARSKPYRVVSAGELSADLSIFGSSGSPTSVSEIHSIERTRMCEVVHGVTVDEKVTQLIGKLKGRGLFEVPGISYVNAIGLRDKRLSRRSDEIWVVVEFVRGQIRNVTYELLGKAIELADRLEGELCAVVIGAATDEQNQQLIVHGADKVYVLSGSHLSAYSSDAYASALAEAVSRFKPYAVLAGSTSFGRDFIPRFAAQLNLGMTSDCIGLEIDDSGQLIQLKPAFGGNIVAPILSLTRPQVATVRPGMLTSAIENPNRKGNIVEVKLHNITPLAKVVQERFEIDRDALRLDSANVIVAVGAGIGRPDNLRIIGELAEVLNAPIAATRKVVDLGWLPRQLQIGLTGRSVGPDFYFAIGIRGAFNHMVGSGRAKTIVCINKDPEASIFKCSDYGIVGDYAEVVPELTRQLRGDSATCIRKRVVGRA